jgi:putative tryptophan/tyrosine transport system substrate-binding protein
MRRREFITLLGGAASVWPLGAGAQQSGTKRIGVLVLGDSTSAPFLEGLQSGLRHLGYSEGRDIQFEVRSARGHADDLAALAAELVRLNVDVIVAYATSAATAAKQATKDIPIVMYVADPVATGLINSFARPGGNITGVSIAMSETGAKNLELIHELLPSARRVAVLLNATEQSHEPLLDHIQAGAGPMKVEIKPTLVRSNDELEGDFADIATWRADAVLVQPSLALQRIADLALQYRLPTASPSPTFSRLGGLISYSADSGELYLRVAGLVDKILKGSKPADLPVELPTKFRLTVNLKTAKVLGIAVPPTILVRADEVIE